jgi:hypothetical protein
LTLVETARVCEEENPKEESTVNSDHCVLPATPKGSAHTLLGPIYLFVITINLEIIQGFDILIHVKIIF